MTSLQARVRDAKAVNISGILYDQLLIRTDVYITVQGQRDGGFVA